MNPRDAYAEAANLLMEGGHCKHALETEAGEHCALGALQKVLYGETSVNWRAGDQYSDWRTFVAPLHDAAEARGYRSIVQFNNADETTAEDVIMIFKELTHAAE